MKSLKERYNWGVLFKAFETNKTKTSLAPFSLYILQTFCDERLASATLYFANIQPNTFLFVIVVILYFF